MPAPGAAFLFDLDGTLCDSGPGIVLSIRHAMAALGRPLQAGRELNWCVGPPLSESFAKLLETTDKDLVQAALDQYRRRYGSQGVYENELYPGIVDALIALGPFAPLYVVTSKPTVFAAEIVRHFGIKGLFQGVFGSGLDGSLGDKGELIAEVLKSRGLDAGACAMVGDREHDMAGAAANGVRAVGVLWGYGSEAALRFAGAQAFVRRPLDLPATLVSPH